ncbi:MAG: GDSL-type esterase/lipase family protein [Peptococcaceae bacterium]|nr:GDSL-type esterase/lipase family protein [Peptococcaceae bacterium]
MRLSRQKKRSFLRFAIAMAFFFLLFYLASFTVPFGKFFDTMVDKSKTTIADVMDRMSGHLEARAESDGDEAGRDETGGDGAHGGMIRESDLPDAGSQMEAHEKGTAFLPDGGGGLLIGKNPSETGETVGSGGLAEREGSIEQIEQAEQIKQTEQIEPTKPEEPEDPEELWKKTFSPVSVSPPVHISYFDDALFIGDSRVVGLMLYSDLTEATFYAEKGVNILNLLSNKLVIQTGGGKITIPEALQTETFGKIYIKMGLNELGWRNLETFADTYGQVIDQIRELQPDAVFYVQSIIPVSKKKSTEDKIFTNERIMVINELIKKMAWERGIYYLDVYNRMTDLEGYLPEDAGTDGIHMNKKFCKIWLEYLLRHTVRDDGQR